MHHAVSLRLVRIGDRVELELADRGRRPAREARELDELHQLQRQLDSLLAPPPVVIPGLDVRRSEDEAEAGRLLGGFVTRGPTLAAAVGAWLGEARGRGAVPVLVVDTAEAGDRQLPWELIAVDGAPVEVADGGAVLRRLPGPPATPLPAGDLAVVRWVADPDDPTTDRVRRAVDEALLTAGLAPAHPVDDAPEGPVVVHLVGHGRRLAEGFGMASGDEAESAITTAHRLQPLLQRAALVVVDVCEAADTTRAELDSLAGQLLRAGARAVLAPTRRLDVEAAMAAAAALYPALAGGAGVVQAVVEARRAVRGLASPHPDGRWSNLGLFVADLAVLDAPAPVAGGWRPAGWPAPGSDLAVLLERAHDVARRRASGFVGLEHLMLAQRHLHLGGPAARAAADAADGPAIRRLQKLRRVPERDDDWAGTPRLRSIGGGLEPGASAEDLWSLLWSDPGGAMAALGGHQRPLLSPSATAATLDPEHIESTRSPASALEVLGGPEDGRLLCLQPGQTVGRVGGDHPADHVLYTVSASVDPYLSRRALTWSGTGQLVVHRAARHTDGHRTQRVEGPLALKAGHLLELSPATCVRGVA
jgi:hypothetical protein